MFELDRVARLVEIPNVAGGLTAAYKDYTPPRDKIEYPPVKCDPVSGGVEIDPTTGQEKSDFAARVLDTLKKQGDSMVLPDRPEKHFYVILATSRRVPGEKSMLEAYAESSRNPFWSQYALPNSIEEYQKRILAAPHRGRRRQERRAGADRHPGRRSQDLRRGFGGGRESGAWSASR